MEPPMATPPVALPEEPRRRMTVRRLSSAESDRGVESMRGDVSERGACSARGEVVNTCEAMEEEACWTPAGSSLGRAAELWEPANPMPSGAPRGEDHSPAESVMRAGLWWRCGFPCRPGLL